jgi:hypothetical protein
MSQKRLKKIRREEKIEAKKELVELVSFKQIIKQNWKFLVFLLLGVIGLYFNSLHGDFVSDDYATIPQNPNIFSFKDGLKGWMGGLINWFLATIFGIKNPVPYHMFSLLIYLLVLVVSFVFVSLILNQKLAKITTTLFAVLPIHVEAVSWIAGRPYLINALFLLLSMIFLIYFLNTGRKKYLYWLFVFIPLAFFAEKTRFAALPLLAILYWFSFDNIYKKKVNLGKILIIFGCLFLAAVIFIWPALLDRIEAVNSGGADMLELITGPLPYPDCKIILLKILKILQDIAYTTDKCSIHINVSFDEKAEKSIYDLVPIKLLLDVDEDKIYELFPERENNYYAKSVKQIIPFKGYTQTTDSVVYAISCNIFNIFKSIILQSGYGNGPVINSNISAPPEFTASILSNKAGQIKITAAKNKQPKIIKILPKLTFFL